MKTLVIYDSVFGNTEKVAQAIAGRLAQTGEAEALPVARATPQQLSSADLLVVGSPTRGFRATEGLTAWLAQLPAGSLSSRRAAAFDTRIALDTIKSPIFRWFVNRGGYAAKIINNALVKAGAQPVAAPEGFFVLASEGPLKDGELERAAAWAAGLAG